MKKYIAPSVKMVKIDNSVILSGSVDAHNELGDCNQLARGNRRGTLTDWDDDED